MTLARYMCCVWKARTREDESGERQESETFAVQTRGAPTRPLVPRTDAVSHQDPMKRMLTDFEKWRPLEEPSPKRAKHKTSNIPSKPRDPDCIPVIEQMPTPFLAPDQQVMIDGFAESPSRIATPRGRPNVSGDRPSFALHKQKDSDTLYHGTHEVSGLGVKECS